MRSVRFVKKITYVCDNCMARSPDVLPRGWIAVRPDSDGFCHVSPSTVIYTGKDDAIHFCSTECMAEFIEESQCKPVMKD